jgi:HPt (histidine-containing phosphotransfer) domain-containing protein
MAIENINKVTNLDYLKDLSKGNPTFVDEMIEIFLTESPEEIRLLEKGILERNFELIKSSAHKMRSTIPFLGLDKIIETEVLEIEKLAGLKTDIQKIEIDFSKIKDVFLKAIEELQK